MMPARSNGAADTEVADIDDRLEASADSFAPSDHRRQALARAIGALRRHTYLEEEPA